MKTGKIKIILIALLILGAGMMAKAQEKKTAQPNDQAWLQKFVGKWTGTVVMTDDKKQSFKITSHMDFSPVADGNGVYGVESIDDPKLGKSRSSYLMGYDPFEKKLHFYAVDNHGICHDHDCTWKSPDHLYIEHNSTRDGKAFKEATDLTFKDRNTIEYTETDFLGGNITGTYKGSFTKSGK